jgi:hypothetical protein
VLAAPSIQPAGRQSAASTPSIAWPSGRAEGLKQRKNWIETSRGESWQYLDRRAVRLRASDCLYGRGGRSPSRLFCVYPNWCPTSGKNRHLSMFIGDSESCFVHYMAKNYMGRARAPGSAAARVAPWPPCAGTADRPRHHRRRELLRAPGPASRSRVARRRAAQPPRAWPPCAGTADRPRHRRRHELLRAPGPALSELTGILIAGEHQKTHATIWDKI